MVNLVSQKMNFLSSLFLGSSRFQLLFHETFFCLSESFGCRHACSNDFTYGNSHWNTGSIYPLFAYITLILISTIITSVVAANAFITGINAIGITNTCANGFRIVYFAQLFETLHSSDQF
jgi:hypothetical protein